MRVLVLSTRFPNALKPWLGYYIERQALELAARPGVEVEIVAPLGLPPFPLSLRGRHRRVAGLPRQETWKGLQVHRPLFTAVPYHPSARVPVLSRRLLSVLPAIRERFPFDVISAEFSWPEGPAAVRAGRALSVPVSIKARGMEFETRLAAASTRRSVLDACARADGLLAVSGAMREQMIAAGLAADRIRVLEPGLDHKLFRPRDRARAKAALGVAGPLVLVVGNLIPQKAQHLALEAIACLDGVRMIIAGNGPERPRLERLVRALGLENRVQMLGMVPHPVLPGLYAAADLLIHPSRVEGFANVRIEALACGTPVVTTAVGGAARILDRPEAGRIVAPVAREIAAAAAEMLDAPPTQEAVAAVAETYSWERSARELEQHLRALARNADSSV